ncbi:molybdopterin cofactor-binding domain-containing protein [Streptomyces sp. NPDC090073]|uniref:molybdopterin cofactor-binding domain-containing protein n=1 Tax=Streptomyces sp. NPDC090073 TaxID=3365936 RepID=UPI00380C4A19
MDHPGRRRVLTYLVAGPVLTVAARAALDVSVPAPAHAAVPSVGDAADLVEIADLRTRAAEPAAHLLVLEVGGDGTAELRLPRTQVEQGVTTAVAMLVAEELDIPLTHVRVRLVDARSKLPFDQFTYSSHAIRSLYDPIRTSAGLARARLVAAAAADWGVPAKGLVTREGNVIGPDGRSAPYATLAAAAASPQTAAVSGAATPDARHQLIGTPVTRLNARAVVTGSQRDVRDLEVAGAKPCMVRRPPTINGTVREVHNARAVRAMPGVLDVVTLPTGVAVVAQTFGQALNGKNALDVSWGPGTIDALCDEDIRRRLRAGIAPFAHDGRLPSITSAFDFAFVAHAPLETNCAVADVRPDRAVIWSRLHAPMARKTIACDLGLPEEKVTVHVLRAAGSFGRRLFFDGALEAARVSKASGRPIRLMWSRIDDMRHGRMRPATHHQLRAVCFGGNVISFQHRVACVEGNFRHGLGEMLTATAAHLPAGIGNAPFTQTYPLTSVRSPYDFGLTHRTLTEVPLAMHTGSWRSVCSAHTRGAEEMVVDEVAEMLHLDPVAFRRARLKNPQYQAVLDTVARQGRWGRSMPRGWAQGFAVHEGFKSCTACLVEIDATHSNRPRVARAVIAADVGRAVNPKKVEAQLLGGLTDAIATTLRASLHTDRQLPLEGIHSPFPYARQHDTPRDVRVFVIRAHGEPGGVGELGVPAAVGAIANAFARATGRRPRSFPIDFDVDYAPFPR